MFQKGEYVVTQGNGVCYITGIEEREFMKKKQDYLVLEPIADKRALCYIPVVSADEQIRYVMGEEEVYSLIDSIPDIPDVVVENERYRQDIYKKYLWSDDVRDRLALISHTYRRMQDRIADNKKVMVLDERFFARTVQLLHGEIAFSLKVDIEEVEQVIRKRIGRYY